MKYVVIYDNKDDLIYVPWITDNYYEALGRIFSKLNQEVSELTSEYNNYELVEAKDFIELNMDEGFLFTRKFVNKGETKIVLNENYYLIFYEDSDDE